MASIIAVQEVIMPKRIPLAVRRAAEETGEHFANWRKVLSLTAAQVADRAHITRDTLRKIEHGDPSVSFQSVLRVARALGVLDSIPRALDPLSTDLGRARWALTSRQRIRDTTRPRTSQRRVSPPEEGHS